MCLMRQKLPGKLPKQGSAIFQVVSGIPHEHITPGGVQRREVSVYEIIRFETGICQAGKM